MKSDSQSTMGGKTARVSLEDENYLIVQREEEAPQGFSSIDISFRSHIIRVYDDRPWQVHHMNKGGQTIEFPMVDNS